MNDQELEVLGIHAVAVVIACELLAQASHAAKTEDWLALVIAKAHTRLEQLDGEQLQAIVNQVIAVLPKVYQGYEDEPSRFPFVNQDDPNKPGPGDQF